VASQRVWSGKTTIVTAMTASDRVVVDSSGWLEYMTDGTKANLFAPYFEGEQQVLVPAIVFYEVRKILLLRRSKELADVFVSQALNRILVHVDEWIALNAASLGIHHQLAMADALIYAAARYHTAELITSDAHFANLPGVTIL
jgi:predicted nucleic acid-binding protein